MFLFTVFGSKRLSILDQRTGSRPGRVRHKKNAKKGPNFVSFSLENSKKKRAKEEENIKRVRAL